MIARFLVVSILVAGVVSASAWSSVPQSDDGKKALADALVSEEAGLKFEAALEAYGALADDEKLSADVKILAAVGRARCLRKLGRRDEAAAAFAEIVMPTSASKRVQDAVAKERELQERDPDEAFEKRIIQLFGTGQLDVLAGLGRDVYPVVKRILKRELKVHVNDVAYAISFFIQYGGTGAGAVLLDAVKRRAFDGRERVYHRLANADRSASGEWDGVIFAGFDDPDPVVRAAAVSVIPRLSRSENEAWQRAFSDVDPVVRKAAVKMLASANRTDPEVRRRRLGQAAQDPTVLVRFAVAAQLRRLLAFSRVWALGIFANLMRDGNDRVRTEAYYALGEFEGVAYWELVEAGAADSAVAVRWATAHSLPKVGSSEDPRRVSILDVLLSDRSEKILSAAAQLAQAHPAEILCPTPQAQRKWLTRAASNDENTRALAISVLARVGSRDIWPELVSHLANARDDVASAVQYFAQRWNDVAFAPALIEAWARLDDARLSWTDEAFQPVTTARRLGRTGLVEWIARLGAREQLVAAFGASARWPYDDNAGRALGRAVVDVATDPDKPALLRVLRDAGEKGRAGLLLETVRFFGAYEPLIESCHEWIGSPSTSVRREAARVLAPHARREHVRALIGTLRDDQDLNVVREVKRALTRLVEKDDVELLEDALERCPGRTVAAACVMELLRDIDSQNGVASPASSTRSAFG